MADSLHRFVFEHLPVRGEIVQLNGVWHETLQRRHYPEPVRAILGQAMAAAALLASTVKGQGELTLQLQGQGPLYMLVSQCTGDRGLRGLARWREQLVGDTLTSLCQPGTLVITLDPQDSRERYQGMVDLDSANLAGALENYFSRSEQLPTLLHLAANSQRAVGWLLQRLPQAPQDPDPALDWERICHLAATVSADELAQYSPTELLTRVFAEDQIRLFPAEPLHFHCSCNRDRIAQVLISMGNEEVQDILEEQGMVSVACEFCGQDYRFDTVDCVGLFTATQSAPSHRQH